MLPLRIGPDLSIRTGGAIIAVLTPRQALTVAEQLIRKSTRRMMVEEALAEPRAHRAPRTNRQAN